VKTGFVTGMCSAGPIAQSCPRFSVETCPEAEITRAESFCRKEVSISDADRLRTKK
jgi:hypothetical protein